MKTVIVTGATSGIGAATARRFAKEGHRVIITGRSMSRLSELARELGAACKSLPFDVRDAEAAQRALRSLPDDWQQIDILVNNAGLALGLEPEYEGSLSDWETMIDTNVKGLLIMTRLVVPGMVTRGRGHIINIGSVAGDTAYRNGAVYCATKAAVQSLTDGLRIDLVDTPIRVSLLKPGLVETNFSRIRFHGDAERAAGVYRGIRPLTADDIADAALYCAQAPDHVQIAEMLVLATNQANGYTIHREQS